MHENPYQIKKIPAMKTIWMRYNWNSTSGASGMEGLAANHRKLILVGAWISPDLIPKSASSKSSSLGSFPKFCCWPSSSSPLDIVSLLLDEHFDTLPLFISKAIKHKNTKLRKKPIRNPNSKNSNPQQANSIQTLTKAKPK